MSASVGYRNVENSIDIGPGGQIHLAYRNVVENNRNLKHALWDGSIWQTDFVDETNFPNFVGEWHAIAVDSQVLIPVKPAIDSG